MKVCACTILKNESIYDINEWLKHLFEIIKIDHVIINDNNDLSNKLDKSQLYNNDEITIYDIEHIVFEHDNIRDKIFTYDKFQYFDYIFICDIDEFLDLNGKDIHDIIKEELIDKDKLELSIYWRTHTDNNIIYEKNLKYNNKILDYPSYIDLPYDKYNGMLCYHASMSGEVDITNIKSINKILPHNQYNLHESIGINYNKQSFADPNKYCIHHYRTQCLEKYIKRLATVKPSDQVINYKRFAFGSPFEIFFTLNQVTNEKIDATYELCEKYGYNLTDNDCDYLEYLRNNKNIPINDDNLRDYWNWNKYTKRQNKIWIFTIATSVYNEYLEEQYETFNNLFPNHEKVMVVISDQEPIKSEINKHIDIRYYKITDHPYPLVTLSKYIYICDAIPFDAKDDDTFVFIDADTKFLRKENNFYDNLYNKINQYDLIFTIAPWQNLYKRYFSKLTPSGWPSFMEKYDSYAHYMNDPDINGTSHYDITDKTTYCQTSFFAGKIGKLKEFNDDVRKLMSNDLNTLNDKYIEKGQQELFRHIPLASEENYTNKIINDHIHNKIDKYNILIGNFILCNYTPFNEIKTIILNDFPSIFLEQKYNFNIKKDKRNKR